MGPPAHPRGPSGWAQVGGAQVGGAQVGGPTWGPSGWAHVGPKWVGPRGAQVGGPKLGPSGWAPQAGPKWTQARNLGPKQIKKIKIIKIKIRSAQNVGKVWISRKKSSWPHLGPFHADLSMDRKHAPIFFLATRILILIIFICWTFWGPKFLAWARAWARA